MRFRIPADLVGRLGTSELQKSLHTKELGEARSRCQEATTWFRTIVEALRTMPDPSRAELERAAVSFFDRLKLDVDQPRFFNGQPVAEAIAYQVDLSETRVRELDLQLVTNEFDDATDRLASAMLIAVETTMPAINAETLVLARQLAVRAARQQMLYFVHQLTSPASSYVPTDDLFARAPPPVLLATSPVAPAAALLTKAGISLGAAVKEHLRKKKLRGLGQSQFDEIGRALGWLQEVIDQQRPLSSVTKDELREFRDDLECLDVTLRGRNGPFKDRLTNVRANQIKSVTSSRYWKSTQAFFSWCEEEGFLEANPSAGLKVEKRKGETKRTPEPFTVAEVKAFLSTPLYTGYLSERSPTKLGDSQARGVRWWAGVLPLFTALRAGELSQLLPADFIFDAPIPHLKVREEDDMGQKVKSTKNLASVRDVPIASTLMKLGLREFVESQAKKYPKERVFRGFRLGARDRISDGMTKFWGAYLKTFNLWKPGRATHVARHTIIARLRAQAVPAEDISAFVGHSQGTMTSQYGGAYPLDRKSKTAETLDYGFDVVSLLGGAFDPTRHLG